jgi:hypothetical protein
LLCLDLPSPSASFCCGVLLAADTRAGSRWWRSIQSKADAFELQGSSKALKAVAVTNATSEGASGGCWPAGQHSMLRPGPSASTMASLSSPVFVRCFVLPQPQPLLRAACWPSRDNGQVRARIWRVEAVSNSTSTSSAGRSHLAACHGAAGAVRAAWSCAGRLNPACLVMHIPRMIMN